MSRLRYAVVVCTRFRPAALRRCLRSVARLNPAADEVIVVDNSAGDAATRDLAAEFKAHYILQPEPGLSRARNTGARAVNADIIAYIDDDAVPSSGWLSALGAEFADPRVGAVAGSIHCSLEPPENGSMLEPPTDARRSERKVVDRTNPAWFEFANFGGLGDGGNMAFRAEAFRVWPGFDARLGRGAIMYGGEEHLAFFSLIALGYKVVYAPSAMVWHPAAAAGELRQRQLRDLQSSTAYMTLLWCEQPAYRGRLFKYVMEGLLRRRRPWRNPAAASPGPPTLGWSALRARLSGPFVYARLRRERPKVHWTVTAPVGSCDD